MRLSFAPLLLSALACGEEAAVTAAADAAVVAAADAAVAPPDAAPPDAVPVEDLDLQLADFPNFSMFPGLQMAPGRGYQVANPLGHQAEALAVASSPTGGTFPVGSIVLVQSSEVMVKRRRGWNATTRDWEFFRIRFGPGGVPQAFEVRGAEETGCFSCHAAVSSATWDLICDHP
jgi:hypothetical protein